MKPLKTFTATVTVPIYKGVRLGDFPVEMLTAEQIAFAVQKMLTKAVRDNYDPHVLETPPLGEVKDVKVECHEQ